MEERTKEKLEEIEDISERIGKLEYIEKRVESLRKRANALTETEYQSELSEILRYIEKI